MTIRPPREGDAAQIWQLVNRCDALDTNSPYAYLLLCSHFADTGLVIRRRPESTSAPDTLSDACAKDDSAGDPESAEGPVVAFVLGYRPPANEKAVFVWQVAVAAEMRGQGLGRMLLDALFDRCHERHATEYLEATVTPSNMPSRSLFTHFARDRDAQIQEHVAYDASSFPVVEGAKHEDEICLRIGPIRSPVR